MWVLGFWVIIDINIRWKAPLLSLEGLGLVTQFHKQSSDVLSHEAGRWSQHITLGSKFRAQMLNTIGISQCWYGQVTWSMRLGKSSKDRTRWTRQHQTPFCQSLNDGKDNWHLIGKMGRSSGLWPRGGSFKIRPTHPTHIEIVSYWSQCEHGIRRGRKQAGSSSNLPRICLTGNPRWDFYALQIWPVHFWNWPDLVQIWTDLGENWRKNAI